MPPKEKDKGKGNEGKQATATSDQARIQTSAPLQLALRPTPALPQLTPPVSISLFAPPRLGTFNFFGLPKELRSMIYTSWLLCSPVVTIGECATVCTRRPTAGTRQWTIRIRMLPKTALLVNHEFYDEALPACSHAATVILQIDRRGVADYHKRLTIVDPLVGKLRKCVARVDVNNLQDNKSKEILDRPVELDGPLAAIDALKKRLFDGLNHMTSLASVEVEVFRTGLSEEFPGGIASLVAFEKLENMQSAKIVFIDEFGDEKLVHEWQRGMVLPED